MLKYGNTKCQTNFAHYMIQSPSTRLINDRIFILIAVINMIIKLWNSCTQVGDCIVIET
jgi:hypothetical protein